MGEHPKFLEDRLVAALAERRWLLDGRRLRTLKDASGRWPTANLASSPSRGFQSGPDLWFHDDLRLILVEAKVAKKGGTSKPELLCQAYGYACQARVLLRSPQSAVSWGSKNETATRFIDLAASSGARLTPDSEIIVVLATLKPPPDEAKHVQKHLATWLDGHRHEVDTRLRRPPASLARKRWLRAAIAEGPSASSFRWLAVDDLDAQDGTGEVLLGSRRR